MPFSFVPVFGLQSILSDIIIATPAFFWSLFSWHIFLYLHFQTMCVFKAEVSLLQVAYSQVLFCFCFCFCFIHSAILCLFLFFSFGCIGSSLWCVGLSLQWLLLLWSMRYRHTGFTSCGMWAQQLWLAGSRAQTQQLWRTGLVVLRHVGSSWPRDQTCVPCISGQILNHCAMREAPFCVF